MKNQLILIKVKERLNKIASFDYDNIECWQIVEAYNKIQLEFAGLRAERGEETKQYMDSIGFLLQQISLKGANQKEFFESISRPADYMSYKRISAFGLHEDCPEPRRLMIYLAEEANKDELYKDPNKSPSFEWGETFVTFVDNQFRVHTDGRFTISDAALIYYRKPLPIKIIGCVDPSTGVESIVEQESEFQDDIIERFLIPGTAAQLAGDIESINQYQLNLQNAMRNNP